MLYLGEEYFIKGRMQTGYAVLMTIDGEKVKFVPTETTGKTPKLKDMQRLEARSSWMTIAEAVTQNTA